MAAGGLLLVATLGVLLIRSERDGNATAPVDPLSDAQATTEVVDAAGQVVGYAGLRDADGAYTFASCVNEQDPPYQAVVVMNFSLPQGNPVRYLREVATAMTQRGWREAPTAAEHFGHKLTKAGVTAVFHQSDTHRELATMRISGECRNMTDHRADDPAWRELTDQLQPGK